MIAHPIKIAQASGLFDRVIVSTDDVEIAEVAKSFGAEVPFLRPAELADDHAPVNEAVRHAVRAVVEAGVGFEYVCRIFATAALILPEDLVAGFEKMRQGAEFATSVRAFPHPVERALKMKSGGFLEMTNPEHFLTRTQDLEVKVFDAGQFCWGTKAGFLDGASPLMGKATAPVVLPVLRGWDIDTEDDWQFAEFVYKHIKNRFYHE
jgi:N-acylneuraminate cytidylyltransferase